VLAFVVHHSRVCVLKSVLSGSRHVACVLTHLVLRRRKLIFYAPWYQDRCNAYTEDYGYDYDYEDYSYGGRVLNVAECCTWFDSTGSTCDDVWCWACADAVLGMR
jgi:hypothetical protein